MGADAMAVRDAAPVRAEAPRAGALEALTRRASLNAVAALLDYGVKAIVVVLITPMLVSGLGRTLYGVWEMLARLGTSMTAVDGRPTDALRLIIARHQSTNDDAARRRFVGAALTVWALLLPLLAVAGGLLAWWVAPALAQATPETRGVVRVSAALVIAAFLLIGLASVPEAVLRGMNLGYRRMGVQAGLHIVMGVLTVAAIWLGLGLAGVAAAQVGLAVATGLCFWLLARRFVSWFGVARPRREDVKAVFHVGIWLAAGDVIARLLLASDVIILGAVVAPAMVTSYVLTGYAARTAQGIHIFAAGAAIPGIGGLLGRGELGRARQAREELLLLTWLFGTVVAATILMWNRGFITLWVGAENYAGPTVDVLIALLFLQTIFIRVEAYIIDATLKPRLRVLISGVAMVVAIVLSIVLARRLGIAGVCLGMLTGRMIQSVAYPLLSARSVGATADAWRALAGTWRRMVVSALLLAVAAVLGQRVGVSGWAAWVSGAAVGAAVTAGLALAFGPDAAERGAILSRLRALRRQLGEARRP
ncbi:MAG TPA: oligosaccharide flippase family protein [Gemmatimonadaceae bacterium]|nr:oligosaccharide flippase family protein [Gemmatimonadaceae bacterium]